MMVKFQNASLPEFRYWYSYDSARGSTKLWEMSDMVNILDNWEASLEAE